MTYKDINDFSNYYLNHNQTLFYKQNLDIIKELKENKKARIKYILTKDINLNEFILILFHKKYCRKIEINTPLIYGTYELIFSGLINNLYFHLLFKEKEEEKDLSKIVTLTDYDSYPKNIMTKINENEINSDNDLNDIDDSIYISMNIDESEEKSSEESLKINNSDFNSKIKFIS